MEETINASVFDELEQQTFEHATTGQRFGNYLIDTIVYFIFNLIVSFLLGITLVLIGMTGDEIRELLANKLFVYSIAFINMFVIYTLIEGFTKGRSLGKLITKTRATGEDLAPLTWKQAVARSLCRIIPFEPFSAFNNAPWHDKWTKTMVIKNRQQH